MICFWGGHPWHIIPFDLAAREVLELSLSFNIKLAPIDHQVLHILSDFVLQQSDFVIENSAAFATHLKEVVKIGIVLNIEVCRAPFANGAVEISSSIRSNMVPSL